MPVSNESDGISWRGVASFVVSSWKYMLAGTVLGAAAVATYVTVVPARYEAVATFRMAQVPVLVSQGIYGRQNVEPPLVLQERLKAPSFYASSVFNACGLAAEAAPSEELIQRLRLNVPPSQADYLVGIAYQAESVEVARACASALFDTVRDRQAEESQVHLVELDKQRRAMQARLSEIRGFLNATEKSAGFQTSFLAQRDEINFLARRIEEIDTALGLVAPTRLIAPVYASAQPAFPRRPALLIVLGAVGGCLMGLLINLLRQSR